MLFQHFAITLISFLIPMVASAAEVKVLSWNVYMLPSPIKTSLQAVRNEAIPDRLIDSDYDIMVFQEAFTASFREAMIRKLSIKYPHNYYLKKRGLFSGVLGSGVFVMSRHPFEILESLRYKDCSGEDCFATKGTVLLEIALPSGKKVQLAPTHLNSNRNNAAVRFEQLTQVRDLLSRNKKRGVPQVLIGDLNIAGEQDEFPKTLTLMGMKSPQLSGDIQTTNARVNDCYKTPTQRYWIDHVWVDSENFNASTKLEVVPTDFGFKGKTCPLSDHHAVEAQLFFN